MPLKPGDPVPRVTRHLARWSVKTRRVVLEYGRNQVQEWAHDGAEAHAQQLAQEIAETAQDYCAEHERDLCFQLTAYDDTGKVLGTAPFRVAVPEDSASQQTAKAAADASATEKQLTMLLRHNEQLHQRIITLSEQQQNGLTRALDAQGRVLEAVTSRLHSAETALQRAMERENESQSLLREAMALAESAITSGPENGWKRTIEKFGALVDVGKKALEIREVQQLLDSALKKPEEKKLEPQTTPPTEQQPASDGAGH